MHLRWRNKQKFKQQHFRTPIDHRSLSGQQATFALASDGHPNVGSTHSTDLCPAITYIALSSAPTPRHLPSCDASGSSPVADCGRRANHMLIVAL